MMPLLAMQLGLMAPYPCRAPERVRRAYRVLDPAPHRTPDLPPPPVRPAGVWSIGGPVIELPPIGELERGGIVGSVEIVDCVADSASPWFCGRFGFVLSDPKPLPFYPCKGRLGFFDVPEVQP